MFTKPSLWRAFQFMAAGTILFGAVEALAVEKPRPNADLLLETFRRTLSRLTTSALGLPLVVESIELDDRVQVDVYGLVDYPFDTVANALRVPESWCDIVFLHPNVQACTYWKKEDVSLLTFYVGRKFYQPLKNTRQIVYHFRKIQQQQGYLDVALDADEGPYGTKDHRMRFEAMQLEGGKTFVRVRYSYNNSAAVRVVEDIYFATLGRGKVGFTVTERDRNGNPRYIGGPRGALERSAVRYYFAIQAYMNSLRYPEGGRFTKRISEWYDLTTPYKRQLFDLEKVDYLRFKVKERDSQTTLQQGIGTTP